MEAGLDLPIINPLDAELMGTIDAFHVLFYKDVDSQTYIKTSPKIKKQNQPQRRQQQTSH